MGTRITNCTSLLSAIDLGYININWTYTPYIPSSNKPTLFGVYRHIGNKDEVITDGSLITSWTQLGSNITYTAPVSTYSYRDDSVSTDSQVFREICKAQRAVWYKIETETYGVLSDSMPYFAISHYEGTSTNYGPENCWIEMRSTKAQVLYNTYYNEGEKVWCFKMPNTNLSRTAMDPYGTYESRGGAVWVTDRFNSKAYRFKSKDGTWDRTVAVPPIAGNYLRGVTVDPDTGNAALGSSGQGTAAPLYIYGMLTAPSNQTPAIAAPARPNMVGVQGSGCYGLVGDTTTEPWHFSVQPGVGCIRWYANPTTPTTPPVVIGQGQMYGICLAPDDSVWTTPDVGQTLLYCPTRMEPNNQTATWALSKANTGATFRGITARAPTYNNNNVLISYELWIACSLGRQKYIIRALVSNPNGILTSTTPVWVYINASDYIRLENNVGDYMCCGADSEDNVWVIPKDKDDNIYKLYVSLTSGTTFPLGTQARYPTCNYNDFVGGYTNTPILEYVLTRDLDYDIQFSTGNGLVLKNLYYTLTTTGTNGISASLGHWLDGYSGVTMGTLTAQNWYTSCVNLGITEIAGKKLYPNYTPANVNSPIPYSTYKLGYNKAYMYSDFTGSIASQYRRPAYEKDYTHPDYSEPSYANIFYELTGIDSNPVLVDEDFWNDQIVNEPLSAIQYYTTTGFDNFKLNFEFGVLSATTELSAVRFNSGVTIKNINFNNTQNIYNWIEIYNNPTKIGLPNNMVSISGVNGALYTQITGFFYKNVYTGIVPTLTAGPRLVTINERYPTPKFYVDGYDVPEKRENWFTCDLNWKKSADYYIRDVFNIGEQEEVGSILVGTDPLSCKVNDSSIIRTNSLSAWNWTISSSNVWNPYTSSVNVTTTDSNYARFDTYTTRLNILTAGDIPLLRCGTHHFTLNVEASTTQTSGISSFYQTVSVLEFEPFANFWAISAQTVSATYSDDTIGVNVSTWMTDNEPPVKLPTITYDFVSGFAPNLTIWFVDSSEPHTFPISAYKWNFGDYYDVSSNTQTVTPTTLSGSFATGCWATNQTNHIVNHTYVMPGIYTVTLTVESSCTGTESLCAKFDEMEQFYVYVREISPQCSLSASTHSLTGFGSSVSGTSPLNVYFTTSSVIAGSFPICRIDVNFGDGTNVESITRSPVVTSIMNHTSSVNLINISAYPDVIYDLRNWIIPHTYTAYNDISTFATSISVYACNTNTISQCLSTITIGPITPLPDVVYTEKRHLLTNRYINNEMLLVFEGETDNSIYNIALSGI